MIWDTIALMITPLLMQQTDGQIDGQTTWKHNASGP